MPKVPPVTSPLPEPITTVWPANTPIIRCYDNEYGSTEFNPGPAKARFRPIHDGPVIVPTIYGADLADGALSETVFHSVPVKPSKAKRIREASLRPKLLTSIACDHDLKLLKLTGTGLGRIGVTHAQLIESSANQYPATALWAQALYDEATDAHGMVWRSRQNNDAEALVIWGTRVARKNLVSTAAPLALAHGKGLDQVREIALQLQITLVS